MLKIIINSISRGISKIKHAAKEIKLKRSSKWKKVEDAFRDQFPLCAVCGSSASVQIHHKKPFHLFPELELEVSNLISLCMGDLDCHLKVGHLGSFKKYNPNIDKDVKKIKRYPHLRNEIIKKSLNDFNNLKKLS